MTDIVEFLLMLWALFMLGGVMVLLTVMLWCVLRDVFKRGF